MIPNYSEFNRKKICWYSLGDGPVLVLLHGFLESSPVFFSLAEQLATHFRVLCIDLPGHGNSETHGEIHSMQLCADVVASVMKSEKVKAAFFVGHSMGGYVALSLLDRYPEYCKGLCLLNSTAFADTDEKKKDRDRAVLVMQKNISLFIKEAIPNLFAENNRASLKAEIEKVIAHALETSAEGAAACTMGMRDRPDQTQLLQKSAVPVLIIAGKYDGVIPMGRSQAMAELHSEIRLSVMENSGHMSFLEEPEKSKDVILEFGKEIFSN